MSEPGRAAAPPAGDSGAKKYDDMSMEEKVDALNALIAAWREPGLVRVRADRVIPDTTNREYTGLSSMHTHYIADNMQRKGFTPRCNVTGAGHDLPLLVRETTTSELGAESLGKWLAHVEKDAHFPRAQAWMTAGGDQAMLCSLGNGHFNQALNLIATNHPRRFGEQVPGIKASHHSVGKDDRLRDALSHGVPSLVLREGLPLLDRKFISLMLNSTFEFKWVVDPDGTVRVDRGTTLREYDAFDGLTKHADSFELDEIIELKIKQEAKEHRDRAAEKKRALEAKRAVRARSKL
eukprot:TRINITY_DN28314_c0_g1_i1.p1 TRINITY_DN28314_c0_g1~~TRINITY_DN28314_c0_g1_i1.p1  ORF type:complete len:293 (+),score=99.24 TRINITY_DN28314_c0_g1_i1:72-950(+)